MPDIDLNIMVHEIKTYMEDKPTRQCPCPFHPKEDAMIKAEVEKNLCAGIFYLVPLTNWVSIIVPIMKTRKNLSMCRLSGY